MKILILYKLIELKSRNTINEHLKCFERYSNHNIYYLNVAFGVPKWAIKGVFDLIIYHYTICSLKWSRPEKSLFTKEIRSLADIKGYKIAIPQDEYVNNKFLCKFFKEQGISSIFTCFFEEDYQKAYPIELTGVTHIETILPGYLDENALTKWSSLVKRHADRKIDLGYRARKNPYWLGQLGVYKWKVADKFIESKDNLIKDISTSPSDVFYDNDWYKFLSNCRCVLGTESGSSLLDFDGKIKEIVEKFQKKNPNASFEDCEKACFKGLDNNINLSTVSPRHFEAMITRTCQVLVEGRYANILQPDLHYIPIKRDFSNISEVIKKIKDVEYCEKIALNCFNEVITSKKITYRDFVNQILSSTQLKFKEQNPDDNVLSVFVKYESYPFIYKPITYVFLTLRAYIKSKIIELGLSKYLIRK